MVERFFRRRGSGAGQTLVFALALAFFGARWQVSVAQEGEAKAPSGLIAEIEAERKALPEATAEDVLAKYKRASEEAKLAADFAAKTKSAAAETAATEGKLNDTRDELAQFAAEREEDKADASALERATRMSLTEIEAKLEAAQAALEENQSKSASLAAEPQRRAEWRRVDYPRESERARQALDQLRQSENAPRTPPEEADAADRLIARASTQRLENELAWLEALRKQYEAQVELIAEQRELAARRAAESEKEVRKWREIANARRKEEAQAQAETARLQAIAAHPLLKQLADENQVWANRRTEVAGELAAAEEKVERQKEELDALNASRKSIEPKVELQESARFGGMSGATGILLRQRLAQLPDAAEYRRRIRERQPKASEANFELIDVRQEQQALSDLDARVAETLNSLGAPLAGEEREELDQAARELLETRREILSSLAKEYEKYTTELSNADDIDQRMAEGLASFEDYLREHVLWVRSRPLSMEDVRNTPAALAWLTDKGLWAEAGAVVAEDAGRLPFLYAIAFVLVAAIVVCGRRLRKRIAQLGSEAAGYGSSMRPTLETVLWTVVIALPPGLVAGFLWWRLSAAVETHPRVAPIAVGLRVLMIVLFTTEILRHVLRKQGLAEAHFGWRRGLILRARHSLRWLLVLIAPIAFGVAAIEAQENELFKLSAGRLGYIAGMAVVAAFAFRVLRAPERDEIADAAAPAWWRGVRATAWPISASLAILLASAAALGWNYAAVQVTWRLQATLWLLLGLSICYALLTRWLLVARRRVAIRQARERREATQASAKEGETPEAAAAPESVNPNASLTTINVQTTRLLRASLCFALLLGAWLIWRDLLPALRAFDAWTGPVAATQLLLAFGVLAMTVIAARNAPGLLEIAVLERLPLDHGARYAISSLTAYLTAAVGILITARTVGLVWEDVQWLLAAITVGLGFGLQEIFANFVSGVIILFERPMRVGDVVTIEGMTGTVTKIRIRATTMTDGDHRELIVPNKAFITSRLVNWTLSDNILRQVISVSVPHGSDMATVRKLLLQAAASHPSVLQEPGPAAVLDRYGASSAEFELRVFHAGPEKAQELRHDLHVAIERMFGEEGIEIAAPRQDIHVRSAPEQVAAAAQTEERHA